MFLCCVTRIMGAPENGNVFLPNIECRKQDGIRPAVAIYMRRRNKSQNIIYAQVIYACMPYSTSDHHAPTTIHLLAKKAIDGLFLSHHPQSKGRASQPPLVELLLLDCTSKRKGRAILLQRGQKLVPIEWLQRPKAGCSCVCFI